MKKLLAILLLCAGVTGYGQGIITESELPQQDSSYLFIRFDANPNLFDAGEGITWELGNINALDTFGINVQSIVEAPLSAQLVFSGNLTDPEYLADHFYAYNSSSLD